MKERIMNRVIECADLVLEGKTIREVAKQLGVSKSTVHNDIINRLPLIDSYTHQEVKKVLEHHKEVKHLRGGEATKRKWEEKRLKLLVNENVVLEVQNQEIIGK